MYTDNIYMAHALSVVVYIQYVYLVDLNRIINSMVLKPMMVLKNHDFAFVFSSHVMETTFFMP